MRQSLNSSLDEGDDSALFDPSSLDPAVPNSPSELFGIAGAGLPSQDRSAGEPSSSEPRTQDLAPLRSLGLDRVIPQDLELYTVLGKLAVQREYEVEDFSALTRRRRERDGPKRTAAIVYLGRYVSGQAFEGPVTVLIKEYLQGSRAVAVNELRLLRALAGEATESVWKTATEESSQGPPVIRALGCFVADASDQALQDLRPPPEDNAPIESLWVVYQWTNMRPATAYPAYQQPEPVRWFGGEKRAAAQRRFFLKAFISGSLAALRFCHERGVVHGSIGSGCLMLSTYADREGPSLVVKLEGLGFGRDIKGAALSPAGIPATAGVSAEDSPLALALLEDRRAMAVALLEVIFGALLGPDAESGEGWASVAQRLLLDVFKGSVADLRTYCEGDALYQGVCEFLGADGAGWRCLEQLMDVEVPLAEVLRGGFLAGVAKE